ncbi:toxin [Priestia megaterium]|nr:toxin [Priestia megaterium]
MKKRIGLLLIILVCSSPMMTYSSFERDSVLLKETPLATEVSNRLFISSYVNEIVYVPKNNYDKKAVMNILYSISAIHPHLLKQMVKNKIHVKLFNGELTDEPSFMHLKGKRPRGYSEKGVLWNDVPGAGGSKTVYVKIGHSEKGHNHGSVNLELHELGHTVDRHLLNNIRMHKGFLHVWKAEKDALFPNQTYFLLYPEEYFAETFAMYYASQFTRRQLAHDAPLTYKYLNKVLGDPAYQINENKVNIY